MRIEIGDEALAEAAHALQRYAEIDEQLGRTFAQAIASALARVADNPHLYPALTRRTRRCVLGRFPFTIVYQTLPDTVRVIAVAHHARRPGYWRGR